MINLRPARIFVANSPVDMRKSFDTLADIARYELDQDPLSGDAFVFIGKRRNRLKVLFWEDSGFWLCSKRLEQGTFIPQMSSFPSGISETQPQGDSKAGVISMSQWYNLLEGIVILSSRRLKRYKRHF